MTKRTTRIARLAWLAGTAGVILSASSVSARQATAPGQVQPAEPAGQPTAPLIIPRKPAEKPVPKIEFTPIGKVEVRGTGKIPLILISDYGMDWRVWETFMERNQSRYTMYAINLPGIGGTQAPPAMPSDGFYADNLWTLNLEQGLLKLIEEKKLEKPFIVGHSYGGHMALRMAIHHPELIGGAMTLDGTVTVHLPDQKTPRLPIEERENFVARTISAGERISDAPFMERQKAGIKSVIENAERAEAISSLMESVPKKVLLQYMGEYYAADQWAGITDLKVPVAVLVSLPSSGEAVAATRASRDKWSRWFMAAKKNLDLVWFENTNPIMTESAPFELDRAVHALAHGNFVTGKTRWAKPMTAYVAPEEGGPAEMPRMPQDLEEGTPQNPVTPGEMKDAGPAKSEAPAKDTPQQPK
jgi:pimeloyl-ACP methyl ester carboxylesterase